MFSFAICRNAKLKEFQFILFESDCPYNSVKKIIINLRHSALKLSQFFFYRIPAVICA
ncbi:hypothetical protein HMPREF9701_02198 [Delftia acidovorans CCUG 274B]|nr:hypothetical protein HMPREF9701_02198 [Delftia acidovorans CCUG 274B]